METKLSIQDFDNGRKKVTITLELSPEEKEEMEKKNCVRHVDTLKPIPCQMYLSPDPNIKAVASLPKWNGVPTKSYVLTAARRVTINRPYPGKTVLRIPYPGTLEIGFIHSQDEERLVKWWNDCKKNIEETLRERIFAVLPESAAYKPTETRTVSEQSVNLNPIDPQETKGVRKRGLILD